MGKRYEGKSEWTSEWLNTQSVDFISILPIVRLGADLPVSLLHLYLYLVGPTNTNPLGIKIVLWKTEKKLIEKFVFRQILIDSFLGREWGEKSWEEERERGSEKRGKR